MTAAGVDLRRRWLSWLMVTADLFIDTVLHAEATAGAALMNVGAKVSAASFHQEVREHLDREAT